MVTIKNSIMEAMQQIEQTTTLFYQQKNDEGFQQLEKTLSILMQTVQQLENYKSEGNELPIDTQKLNTILFNALNVMNQKDMIMLSDILIYDLNKALEEYLKVM